MEELQLLRDPDVKPTNELIAEGLGAAANGAYVKFAQALEAHGVQLEWRYYNDGKAWLGKGLHKWTTSRGTPKETTVFWLSIWEGFFRISLFIPEKARADAMNLPLGAATKERLAKAAPVGKLKFFPIIFDLRTDEMPDEIFTLVDFKKTIK